MNLADLHYPHVCGELFRRTMFLGCPVTRKPSRRGESASDIFSLQGEGKRLQCMSASGIAVGTGCLGATLTGMGRRGCLASKRIHFRTHFSFLFLAWGRREKEGKRSHLAMSSYTPQQVPCQRRLPKNWKYLDVCHCATRSPPEIWRDASCCNCAEGQAAQRQHSLPSQTSCTLGRSQTQNLDVVRKAAA